MCEVAATQHAYGGYLCAGVFGALRKDAVMATLAEELSLLLAQLPKREQGRILNVARGLARPPVFPYSALPPGTPGSVVANLRVSPEAGEAMERALAMSL